MTTTSAIENPPVQRALSVDEAIKAYAAEEAGHSVLFGMFGIQAIEARLDFDGAGQLTGAYVLPGDCTGLRPFQQACVGWGGLVAQHLLGAKCWPDLEIPALTWATAGDWIKAVLEKYANVVLSDNDRRWALLDTQDAPRYAYLLLVDPEGRELLELEYKRLSDEFWRQYVAERFP